MSDLRNLAKSPAWEALRKAAEAVGREENDIPAHSFKDPIQGILGQEFGKGFQAGVKRQVQLVDMWMMELDELRKLKAEENALHDEAM